MKTGAPTPKAWGRVEAAASSMETLAGNRVLLQNGVAESPGASAAPWTLSKSNLPPWLWRTPPQTSRHLLRPESSAVPTPVPSTSRAFCFPCLGFDHKRLPFKPKVRLIAGRPPVKPQPLRRLRIEGHPDPHGKILDRTIGLDMLDRADILQSFRDCEKRSSLSSSAETVSQFPTSRVAMA